MKLLRSPESGFGGEIRSSARKRNAHIGQFCWSQRTHFIEKKNFSIRLINI